MIETRQPVWREALRPSIAARRAAGLDRQLRALTIGLLMAMLLVAPIQFLVLPLNLSLVDLLNAAALPVSWLYLLRTNQRLRVPYGVVLWLIFLGSFIGTFAAVNPVGTSLVAIVKDLYLYVWFLTVAAVLTSLDAPSLRRVMLVWLASELLHGALIIAQFVSSDVFTLSQQLTSRFGEIDLYRPSGMFANANSTALFQFVGFVPLFLLRLPRIKTTLLALFLVFSILSTGSMAATAGSLVGFSVAVGALTLLRGPRAVARMFAPVAVMLLVLGGMAAVAISQSAELSERFNYIFADRVEGSAEGRFSLWERGLELMDSEMPLWGIGPDSYKDIDLIHKPLHNDLLAFLVERGLIGTLGLLLLGGFAVAKGVVLLRMQARGPGMEGVEVVVLLAVVIAALVHSQFHQVFHHRSVWLALAAQEALLAQALWARDAVRKPAWQARPGIPVAMSEQGHAD